MVTRIFVFLAIAQAIANSADVDPKAAQAPQTPQEQDKPAPPPPGDPRERPVFVGQSAVIVGGRVMLEGGAVLPAPATVQSVCSGSFGESVQTRDRFRISIGQPHQYGNVPGSMPGGGLIGCELRVTLSGFLPATMPVSNVSAFADLGVIVLRPRTGVSGLTYSITTHLAPKEAQRAFDQGVRNASRNKLADARRDLEKAVTVYPNYAEAWFELGVVHHRQQNSAGAREAYQRSLAADGKFLKPALQLAMLAAAERNWQETLDLSNRVISQNPYEFAQAFLYNAVAHYNLKDSRTAEKSVLWAIELDPQHRLPKAFQLLASILADRGERVGAADQLRLYLKYNPKAPDANEVRARLSELER
jgi:Tfp pilus assembly protein PilF